MTEPPDDASPLFDDDEPGSPPPPALRAVGPEDDEPAWYRALARTDQGRPRKTAGNLALLLLHDEAWRDVFRHEVFAGGVLCGGFPPLPRIPESWAATLPPPVSTTVDDHVLTYVEHWVSRLWGLTYERSMIRHAIDAAARARPIHALQAYLDACADSWDGTLRVDSWCQTYLGAESEGPETAWISRWWLVSCVARAYDPGCKVDHVLVLEGEQGARKNTALEALAGDQWYLPELPDIREKDAMGALEGVWLVCIDELRAIRAADVERVKSFLSRRIDRYRPPYGRETVSRPRTAVFAATTNALQYLTDETGARRYWPVRCTHVDVDAIRRDRDQLWGEAVHLYRGGARWWPDTAEERSALGDLVERRDVVDEWEVGVAHELRGLDETTVGDCLTALGLERRDWRPADQHRVRRCLTRLGWVECRASRSERRRVWRRPDPTDGA